MLIRKLFFVGPFGGLGASPWNFSGAISSGFCGESETEGSYLPPLSADGSWRQEERGREQIVSASS